MIRLGGRILQTGPNIFAFEIRVIFQNSRFIHSGGKQIQHILDPDAHPSDAGTAAALVRVESNPAHDEATIVQYDGIVKAADWNDGGARDCHCLSAREEHATMKEAHQLHPFPTECGKDIQQAS